MPVNFAQSSTHILFIKCKKIELVFSTAGLNAVGIQAVDDSFRAPLE